MTKLERLAKEFNDRVSKAYLHGTHHLNSNEVMPKTPEDFYIAGFKAARQMAAKLVAKEYYYLGSVGLKAPVLISKMGEENDS